MRAIFLFFSRWPLLALHALGAAGGLLAWGLSARYRQRWADNTRRAGLTRGQRWRSVLEAGKLVGELPRLWFGPAVPVEWRGAEHVEAALVAGRGLLFLTPHMGCFEVTAQAYAQRFGAMHRGLPGKPITVLFRPPRHTWLREWVARARQRPGLQTAPTTLSGVRQLMQALKNGEAVGLLPDQVPPKGLGTWAPFWGQPAYTMTLSLRLAQTPGVAVFLAWGERLPWGRGYRVHVQPMEPGPSDAGALNQALEGLIRACPSQYLWGYDRYKAP